MHEFTQAQLKDIAEQSQANVQTIWDMFGLEGPAPQVNAGMVWAVMTAGLGGGWVKLTPPTSMDDLVGHSVAEITEKVEEFIMQVTLFQGPEPDEEVDDAKPDPDLLEDIYHKGYMDGQRALQEKLQPDERVRLVTMTAPVGETVADGSNGVGGEPGMHEYQEELQNLEHQLSALAESQAKRADAAEEHFEETQEKVETAALGGVAEVTDPPDPPAPVPTSVSSHLRLESGQERQAALRSILLDLQEMAAGNVMPSQKTWDEKKPAHQPTAEMIVLRFDLTWADLAERARLHYVNRGGRPAKK